MNKLHLLYPRGTCFLLFRFFTTCVAHRRTKDLNCSLFLVVLVVVAMVLVVVAMVTAVVVAVHYGSKQCDIETLNYTLFHKLGSQCVSERVNK